MALFEDGSADPAGAVAAPESGAPSPDLTPAQPAADPNFNAQDYGYKFRSEMVYPQSKEDMIELMQLGHSYRHNKPTWDREKSELAQQQQQFAPYQNLHTALEGNPQFRTDMWNWIQSYQGQTQPDQPEADQQVTQLSQKMQQFEEKQADADLAREMTDMMSKHADVDWNKDVGEGTPRMQLLQFMSKEKITNPEMAYRAYFFPTAVQNAQLTAAKKTTQGIKQQHKLGVVTGQSAAPPGAPGLDHTKHSMDSLAELAKNAVAQGTI